MLQPFQGYPERRRSAVVLRGKASEAFLHNLGRQLSFAKSKICRFVWDRTHAEWKLVKELLTETTSQSNVDKGQVAGVVFPAGFRAKRPFRWLL
jgi:hypothetical protein